MNKGIPYLLAVLVALTLSAGWAAPVWALFEQAAHCLGSGGSLDLAQLRCVPVAEVPVSWSFWVTLVGVAALVIVITCRQRLHPD